MKLKLTIPLAVALAWCSCNRGSDSGSGSAVAAAMTILGGADQLGVAGKELPQPLRVRVTDAGGHPVAGELVTFHVTSGGGSVFSGAGLTGADGVVQERWTLGTRTADLQQLEARAVDSATGAREVFAVFTATPLPDAPASLQVVSGDGQRALVGATLSRPCTVALADQYANTVPGQTVDWAVQTGGGQVPAPSTTTDTSGRASTSWTMGNGAGPQSLRASVAGLSATFQAVAVPSGPATLSIVSGDGQAAPPGTKVALAPTVSVRDQLGGPVPGVPVKFAVTAGGGSIENPSVQTDSAGRASCGAWTMGAAKGLDSISATADGLSPVSFTAKALNTSADVAVMMIDPSPMQVVGEAVTVAAAVSSTYQITSVQAQAGGASVNLLFGPYGPSGSNAWSGTLLLAGQPRGDVDIVVTATDARSDVTDAMIRVLLDRMPVVDVTMPVDGALARPRLDVGVNCTDDDPAGCASLTVSVNGAILASGRSSISQQVDLSAHEGQRVSLLVTGVDSIGQQSRVSLAVYVESSAHLALKAQVGGPVWDVSDSRILFVDNAGGQPVLKIRDTAASTIQTVDVNNAVGSSNAYGYLTRSGAIYVHGAALDAPSPGCSLYEWRNGTTTNLAGLNSCVSLKVAGDYALYSAQNASTDPIALTLRDLIGGTSASISTAAGNWRNDVGSNGDIAYWTNGSSNAAPGYNIHRVRSGVDVQLTNDAVSTLWNTWAITDGVNIVYQKSTPCCVGQSYRIATHDGTKETLLTAASTNAPFPGTSYAAAGGFVAYASEDASKSLQVWRHGPAGEEQLTLFGTSSAIDSIGPDGTVLLSQMGGRRYVAAPGQALEEIGSSLGRVLYRDRRFVVVLGISVLQVVP